jgi:hypothetical protein
MLNQLSGFERILTAVDQLASVCFHGRHVAPIASALSEDSAYLASTNQHGDHPTLGSRSDDDNVRFFTLHKGGYAV